MNSTLLDTSTSGTASNQTIVASYKNHFDAETAVSRLTAAAVLPMQSISIIGRHFESHEDVQGFYRPADAAVAGAGQGAWYGGFFGLMLGALGFFVFPGVGGLIALGPLAGMIAGAVGGAGVGALESGMVAAGVPRDQALKYRERLQAGEFLVVVHGGASDTARAQAVLASTNQTHLQSHGIPD